METLIRQAVVRIRSLQSLELIQNPAATTDSTGNLALSPHRPSLDGLNDFSRTSEQQSVDAREQDIAEFLVLQKRHVLNKEEDWKVWGTTNYTPMSKFDEVTKPPSLPDQG